MQCMHFFVVLFLSYPLILMGQELSVDPSGRQIVTWPDGSWRYADPDSPEDQRLIESYQSRQRQLGREEVLIRAKDSLLAAVQAEKKARLDKALLEERLTDMKKSDNRQARASVGTLQAELEEAEGLVKEKERAKKEWEELVEFAEKLALSTDEEAPAWEEKLKTSGLLLPGRSDNDRSTLGSTPIPEIAAPDPTLDLLAYPPSEPCDIAPGPVDQMTGTAPMRAASAPLFSFTSERLRPLMGTEEFVTGNGFLTRMDRQNWVFTLEITVASQFAQKEFGMLEKGSLIVLYMISGAQFPLYNAATSTGLLNPVEKSVSYTGRYPIDKRTQKALRSMELDKVRVVWSTGYEDYEIYDLDFFSRQFQCLDQ